MFSSRKDRGKIREKKIEKKNIRKIKSKYKDSKLFLYINLKIYMFFTNFNYIRLFFVFSIIKPNIKKLFFFNIFFFP